MIKFLLDMITLSDKNGIFINRTFVFWSQIITKKQL